MVERQRQDRAARQRDRESGLMVTAVGRLERRVDDDEKGQQKGGDRTDDLPRQT
ncbi:hypothetical protein GCM10023075_00110 [Streptosporangium album]